MRSLENQLAQVSLKIHEADAGKDDIIRKLQGSLILIGVLMFLFLTRGTCPVETEI